MTPSKIQPKDQKIDFRGFLIKKKPSTAQKKFPGKETFFWSPQSDVVPGGLAQNFVDQSHPP